MQNSNIARYQRWLRDERGLEFDGYPDLWRWSVGNIRDFWATIWEFFEVRAQRPYREVLADSRMPGARWFEGAELNLADHLLGAASEKLAIVAGSESGEIRTLTYRELRDLTGRLQLGLRRLGVRPGDRVAAYLPNIPEAVAAFLATAGIGAIWSSCSPDFGTRAVVERWQQIAPKVLLTVDGYIYNGRPITRLSEIAEFSSRLPSLESIVVFPNLETTPRLQGLTNACTWAEVVSEPMDVDFVSLPFDHPLWIVYTSGTTGLPKAIVHGHGGVLLEMLKQCSLHFDVRPDDRFFWFSTTGWIMWNITVCALSTGATICIYDGSPTYPDLLALWRFVEMAGITYFGTSASFIQSCIKVGLRPSRTLDLSSVRQVGSTGSPLSPEGFGWIQEAVGASIPIGSSSGGTDVATGFFVPCPLLPVYAGELQCAALGVDAKAFDDNGRMVVAEVGELVCTQPIPSMPLYFWNDAANVRYTQSYFDRYPGVWRHGDWIKVTERGSAIVYGRSDSTLNRGGVRMGTSEFYRVVEDMPEIQDSVVVDLTYLGREGRLLLYVVLSPDAALDHDLRMRINHKLRVELSPRHVPDEIQSIPEVPRTLNGKKLEVPIKRILLGLDYDKAVTEGAVSNPAALRHFVQLAEG